VEVQAAAVADGPRASSHLNINQVTTIRTFPIRFQHSCLAQQYGPAARQGLCSCPWGVRMVRCLPAEVSEWLPPSEQAGTTHRHITIC
jgi:hypothetical protein